MLPLPLLKLELRGDGDVASGAGRAPHRRCQRELEEAQLGEYMSMLIDCRVALIEQPLPVDADDALGGAG